MPRAPKIKEVWVCRYCGYRYEALLTCRSVCCPKGHIMKKEKEDERADQTVRR